MKIRDWHDEDDFGFDPTADSIDYIDNRDQWYPFADEAEARQVLENPDAFADEWAAIDTETERGLWALLDRAEAEPHEAPSVRNTP